MPAPVRAALPSFAALLVAALAPAALAQGGGLGGPPPDDPCPAAYPGDAADKARIARWMARGAALRGLPDELPAMVALAETGVANIRSPDRRYVGYFQMDIKLWNVDRYRGYADDPNLQLRWFTDHAVLVRQRAIAEGDSEFGRDPLTWGRWAGIVENPGAPAVSHYQRRLEEAQALVAGDCLPASAAPDATAPTLKVHTAKRQRGAIAVRVRCVDGPCVAAAAALDADDRRRGRAKAIAVAPGKATILTITPHRSRRLRVEVTAVDEAGNAVTVARRVAFTAG
jgi:hypothetical protein